LDRRARLVFLPRRKQVTEGAEQEVPRAAGRIDELHLGEAELLDGSVERLLEDELLDEVRRLQERVALAHRLRQVLVEVTEEPRVAAILIGSGESERRRSGGCVDLLEEIQQRSRSFAGGSEHPDRVVS